MKLQTIALSLALVALPVAAQDKMKDSKDSMMKAPSMQECKDMMAMKKDGMKKDDAMMKKEAACTDMMKKDGGAMKGDAMAPKK